MLIGTLIGLGSLIIVSPPLISSVRAASDVGFYRRSDFTDEASRFDPRATVYIKAELDFRPAEAKVMLKNNDGQEMTSTDLDKSGNRATGALSLPDEGGGYVIEADFRGEGSGFQFSKNITVGDGDSGQTINIRVTNRIGRPPVSANQTLFYPGGVQRQTPAGAAVEASSRPRPTSSPELSPSPAGGAGVASSSLPAQTPLPAGETPPSSPKSKKWSSRIWEGIVAVVTWPLKLLRSLGIGG
jgi:hypothetical protein